MPGAQQQGHGQHGEQDQRVGGAARIEGVDHAGREQVAAAAGTDYWHPSVATQAMPPSVPGFGRDAVPGGCRYDQRATPSPLVVADNRRCM